MAATFEVWRPVVGFERQYEVSDHGRVRRSGRAARTGKGRGGGARIGLVLSQHEVNGRYLVVNLWRDGRITRPLVHRLVAAAFIGECPSDREVNHRDGDKSNNRPEAPEDADLVDDDEDLDVDGGPS